VRKAIGDSGRPWRFVRTVSRYGYAFAGEVVSEARPTSREAAGAFVTEEREYPLGEGETLIGRGHECGLRLLSTQVSRVHARVRGTRGGVTLEDLGSKNGTWVNGERREGAVQLADGDEVTFGTFRVLFRRGDNVVATRTGRPR
jgi:pSer/pThr/pTyr-binding forkhead associated (FHA) protein